MTAVSSPEANELDIFKEPEQTAANFRMKEIRMASALSDTGDAVEDNHFYSVDSNVEQGEDKILTDLGDELEVILLRDAKKVGHYNTETKRMEYDSSEFRSWQENVALYRNVEKDSFLLAFLPYAMRDQDSIKVFKDEQQLPIRMKYVVYVLLRPKGETDWAKSEIHRMTLPVTSAVGADKDDKPLFEEPAKDSLEACKDVLQKETRKQTFNHVVTMKTRKHSKKILLATFQPKVRLSMDDVKGAVLPAIKQLYVQLAGQAQRKLLYGLKCVREKGYTVRTHLSNEELENVVRDPRELISIPKSPMSEALLGSVMKSGTLMLKAKAEPTAAETVEDVTEALVGPAPKKKGAEVRFKAGKKVDAEVVDLPPQAAIEADLMEGKPKVEDVPF